MSSEAKCSSCESMNASDCMDERTILQKLESHPLWRLSEKGHLIRQLEAKSFQHALDFVVLVGAAAERHGHHPDIHITGYRQVELVLYTHSVGGVTTEDFRMVEAIDALPVVYSLNWRKKHPDLAAFAPAPAAPIEHHSKPPHVAGEESVDRAGGVHSGHGTSSHGISLAETRGTMHSLADDGRMTHGGHDFVVHTGHSTLLGRGDEYHRSHAEEKEAERIPASREIGRGTWEKMVHALKSLKQTGFDVGETETYLPMFEMHVIHPAMEADIFKFYKHLLRRLEPDARISEPVHVVEAALGFVEGYEELKSIGPFQNN